MLRFYNDALDQKGHVMRVTKKKLQANNSEKTVRKDTETHAT